tara:strand:+ start:499 stop:729 length:231 start_codon:yes stop_codon:yes gene_type:complete
METTLKNILDDIMDEVSEFWINYNYDNHTNEYEYLGQYEDGKWIDGEWWNEYEEVEHCEFSVSHIDNKWEAGIRKQ